MHYHNPNSRSPGLALAVNVVCHMVATTAKTRRELNTVVVHSDVDYQPLEGECGGNSQ